MARESKYRITVFDQQQRKTILVAVDKILDALEELPELDDRVFAILAVMKTYEESDGINWSKSGLG